MTNSQISPRSVTTTSQTKDGPWGDHSARHFGAMLLLALMWGLSIPVTKLGLQDLPPLTLTALRFAFAVPLMLLFTLGRQAMPLRALPKVAALGLLGIGVGQVAQTFGVAGTSASVGTIVSATIPLFIVVFAAMRLGQHVSRIQALGLLTAFAGIALVALGVGSKSQHRVGTLFDEKGNRIEHFDLLPLATPIGNFVTYRGEYPWEDRGLFHTCKLTIRNGANDSEHQITVDTFRVVEVQIPTGPGFRGELYNRNVPVSPTVSRIATPLGPMVRIDGPYLGHTWSGWIPACWLEPDGH